MWPLGGLELGGQKNWPRLKNLCLLRGHTRQPSRQQESEQTNDPASTPAHSTAWTGTSDTKASVLIWTSTRDMAPSVGSGLLAGFWACGTSPGLRAQRKPSGHRGGTVGVPWFPLSLPQPFARGGAWLLLRRGLVPHGGPFGGPHGLLGVVR